LSAPPHISPPFPYTPLFRSQRNAQEVRRGPQRTGYGAIAHAWGGQPLAGRAQPAERVEPRDWVPRREQHRQPERGQEPHVHGKKFLRLLREQIRVGEGPSGGESRGAWAANTQAD